MVPPSKLLMLQEVGTVAVNSYRQETPWVWRGLGVNLLGELSQKDLQAAGM